MIKIEIKKKPFTLKGVCTILVIMVLSGTIGYGLSLLLVKLWFSLFG